MLTSLERLRSIGIVSILPVVMLSTSTAFADELSLVPADTVVRIEAFKLDPLRFKHGRTDDEFLDGYRILDRFTVGSDRNHNALADLRNMGVKNFRKPRMCSWPNFAFRIVANDLVQELYVTAPPAGLMKMCNAVCEALNPASPRRRWDADWHWEFCFCDCMWETWLDSGRRE